MTRSAALNNVRRSNAQKSSPRSAFGPFEALEGRTLFSGSAADFAAAGFTPVQWDGQQVYAKPGEWVLQLNGLGAEAGKSADKVNKLLDKVSSKSVRATLDLGDDGLVLLKAPEGLDAKAVKTLTKKLPGFSFVEPNMAYAPQFTTPDDQYFSGYQDALNNTGQAGTPDADIDAPEAWDVTTGSASTVVGVIDSGVDYTHPDLAANVWTNPGEVAGDNIDNDRNGYVDDVRGWDFAGANSTAGDNSPMDVLGHGTHVAGTIAAVGNNGIGVSGVNWQAKIMPLRIFDDAGNATEAGIVGAINYATKMRTQYGVNVRVTNNSWGGPGDSVAIDNAIKASGNAGILFVAAAGNNGANNDAAGFYPANVNLPNIVSVAATDDNDALASFSNYGATTVDLAAPGVNIISTIPGGFYGYKSGTSMATPHVTGVAALAFTAAPNATYADVKNAILQGGDSVPALAGKTVTGRRLNAYGTLARLVKPTAATGLTLTAGRTAAGAPLVSLRWTDTAKTEAGYRLERSANGGAFEPLTTLGADAANYDDLTVAPGSAYAYRVTAYGPAGESAPAEAQITLPDDPPAVAQFDVLGGNWSGGFVARLGSTAASVLTAGGTDLPWTNVDQVRIRFSENVTVEPGALAVRGTNVPAYGTTGFSYDPATFTATWKLSQPVAADRLAIDLPASAVTDAAGQPLAAGVSQRVNVLPGDADRNGRVDASDLLQVHNKLFSSTIAPRSGAAAYTPFADVDGDGRITTNDYNAVRRTLFTRLPDAAPAAPAATDAGTTFSAQRIGTNSDSSSTVAQQLESSAVL